MTSSEPSPRSIDVTLAVDVTRFTKTMHDASRSAARLARALKRSPKVHHLPRRSGVGARQVLRPWLGKAIRHPWAHERDANGRIIPLVEGGGPLPQREV